MNLLLVSLGLTIGLMLIGLFSLFVSWGPFLALIGIIFFVVIFVAVLLLVTFCIYKIRNEFLGDEIFYDFDDFMEDTGEDFVKLINTMKDNRGNK